MRHLWRRLKEPTRVRGRRSGVSIHRSRPKLRSLAQSSDSFGCLPAQDAFVAALAGAGDRSLVTVRIRLNDALRAMSYGIHVVYPV